MRRWSSAALLFAFCWFTAATAMAAATPDLPIWSTDQARQDRYVSAHGLRAFVGGYSEDGLEFWAFPLQIVAGYQLQFIRPGQPPLAGIDALESVDIDPLGFTRHYAGPGFRVRERIATRGELPGAIARFEIEGGGDVRIRAHFRPSLNLMWPLGAGGQEMAWDEKAKGFLLSEPSRRLRALVSSPQAIDHSQPNNDRRGSAFERGIFLQMEPAACGQLRCASLVFAGQSEQGEDAHATTTALLNADGVGAADAERFDPASRLVITTPDAQANRALRWAQIALEQAWTCNARLGCGLVGGYGPSHGARRPQYAWYFAGDGLIGTRALIHQGQYARAAAELDFILRYQHPDNGMIWHEMSQSAAFADWARDYPYMYVHVDIAFDFIGVLAEYERASGDRAFLARHWPALRKAYAYCLSTLDAGDGLPRVPADKMSGNEQDRLTDELTLSAAWVEAAHAMSELAALMGDAGLAAQAQAASERARASVRSRYRDEGGQRWISGFSHAGTAGESTSAADLAAIASGAATAQEAAATLDRLAAPGYVTDWGLRSRPDTASDYDPSAYSRGSVWGLGTAAAAEILWGAQRPEIANRLWLSLVPWASADSLGHMHEVMRGDRFAPQSESVPEQMWSSASFLSAAIGGMLGLRVEAAGDTLHFAPQPPASWRMLRVEHIRVGERRIALDWRIENGRAELAIDNAGPAFRLRWTQAAVDGATGASVIEREIAHGRTRLNAP